MMKRFLGISWLVFFLSFMPMGAVAKSVHPALPLPVAAITVEVKPGVVTKGSVCLFVVTSSESVSTLTGKLFGKTVFFNPDASGKKWFGLGGVSLDTLPGDYPLTVSGAAVNGSLINETISVIVELATVLRGGITVPDEFLHPNDEQKEQSKADSDLKRKAFATETPERFWTGSFKHPIDTNIRAAFGGGRTFNRTAKRIHKGVDYRAATGMAIKAANSGRVILAKSMFYDGNMVVIDHGQGLITAYLHLSEIKVSEGEMVKTGQEIGLSGGTGRASGPHLHFQVKWERIDIDPVRLIKLDLPTNLSK